MAPDVRIAFLELLQDEAAMNAEQAAAALEQLKAQGRYLQDVRAST